MAPRQTIFEAVKTGDPGRVKRKLAREPGALAERDADGLSPLMVAVYHGKDDVVETILALGRPKLDVHEAAAVGSVDDLTRLLVRSSARVSAYSRDGFTPLHLAAYFDRPGAAQLLLERGADVDARTRNVGLSELTPLHSAAAGRATDVAVLLLDAGADPNATQPGGWTLHAAAANGNVELCRILLRRKAKRAPMADDRSRPLDFAIEHGHREVVELLQTGR